MVASPAGRGKGVKVTRVRKKGHSSVSVSKREAPRHSSRALESLAARLDNLKALSSFDEG